jgi:hypothetical protein
MARRTIEEVRRALGAGAPERVGAAPHGPFGALQLAAELRERLRPGAGARPGRPTDPDWAVRRPSLLHSIRMVYNRRRRK